uniref:Uncharacterized protein n=1 Tax=Steinernema glaseri TaxID=37863 RepID=A0A1I7ZDD1_9BILA
MKMATHDPVLHPYALMKCLASLSVSSSSWPRVHSRSPSDKTTFPRRGPDATSRKRSTRVAMAEDASENATREGPPRFAIVTARAAREANFGRRRGDKRDEDEGREASIRPLSGTKRDTEWRVSCLLRRGSLKWLSVREKRGGEANDKGSPARVRASVNFGCVDISDDTDQVGDVNTAAKVTKSQFFWHVQLRYDLIVDLYMY